ncbi:unnamed protein product [Aphanomyces euteiches]
MGETNDYGSLQTPSDQACVHQRILHIAVQDHARPAHSYLQAHDGVHVTAEIPPEDLVTIRDALTRPKVLLGQWMATAVCGNDVMSSCSYSSGVVALKAGVASPLGFLVVSLVLYVYRFVYEEVVTAIPLNGGSYNVLLNTTTKRFAAVAACLSILCYTATAVVSAVTGVNYLATIVPSLPIIGTSIAVLGAFAFLMLLGIHESAIVATGIFIFHIATLSILSVVCLIFTIKHPDIIHGNYVNATFPDVDYLGTTIQGTFGTAWFFGFGAAMLGVTGFETSSNFVEEQKPSVFRKTMRNMWSISSFFNILLAVLCFGVLQMDGPDGIVANQNYVLAQMGLITAGTWAKWLVAIDAFVVLAGAVLTAYVGINGLVRRLGSDRVVPAFFVEKNKWRGTCHWIILSFFALATSLVLILDADQIVLSGVYTYSFLSLMFLFGSGCVMLKLKRRHIPRDIDAPWTCILIGMALVLCGILANLLGDPKALLYFVSYFCFVFVVVFAMLERVFIMRVLLVAIHILFKPKQERIPAEEIFSDNVEPPFPMKLPSHNVNIHAARATPVAFFIKDADLTTINKAILYVRANELTHNIRFIHVHAAADASANETVEQIQNMIAMFDRVYPKFQLDFYSILGTFEPATIEWIAERYNISINMMFLKQPTNAPSKAVSAHGVRVITG